MLKADQLKMDSAFYKIQSIPSPASPQPISAENELGDFGSFTRLWAEAHWQKKLAKNLG